MTSRMLRVVLCNTNSGGTSSPFSVHSDEEKAVTKAKRVVLDYPPQSGCFAEVGVNVVEIQVQERVSEGKWKVVRRFHRVARKTQDGFSLCTRELKCTS